MALNYSFYGKSILITGGASGIGKQLVQRFHDDGAKVFTIDKNSEAIQELNRALPNVTAQVVDLNDWDETRKVVESFGVLDHLVNNAGIVIMEPFLEISKESMSIQFNVLMGGIINVSQVMAKGLIAAGRAGSIVNIGSMGSLFGGLPEAGVYSAAKAGVGNLTKSMAIELGPHNIRVNNINPGVVETPMKSSVENGMKKFMDTLEERLVGKRLIAPNEVADLTMFLLSPLANMIMGESVLIDGGYLTG